MRRRNRRRRVSGKRVGDEEFGDKYKGLHRVRELGEVDDGTFFFFKMIDGVSKKSAARSIERKRARREKIAQRRKADARRNCPMVVEHDLSYFLGTECAIINRNESSADGHEQGIGAVIGMYSVKRQKLG